jgi:hypothetical protein
MISAAGFFLYKKRKKVWLLTLAAGTFTHLVLDQIWLAPRTLFWPFLSTTFERRELDTWMFDIFRALMSKPDIYVPEAVGFGVLLWFGLTLIIKKRVGSFIKYGRAD